MGKAKGEEWKVLIFQWGVIAILTIALLELGLFFLEREYGVHYKTYFRKPPISSEIFRVEARKFFRSERFDKDLGWDTVPPVHNYVEGKQFLAQAYGDSFTGSGHGGGVTWQKSFEDLSGEAILNLGVGGYGLDQAILKFEKYGSKYSTRLAILGLYSETYRRALSYHSRYYFENYEKNNFVFKPFFARYNNRYELYRPPCRDEQCLWDVIYDPKSNVRRLVIEHDYWFQQEFTKPKPGFPRVLGYLHALPLIWKSRQQDKGLTNYVFVNEESLVLAKYLVQRFARRATDNGMVPVFLLLYSSRDLDVIKSGRRWDAEILEFLKREDLFYVDTATFIISQHAEANGFRSLSVPDGHLNAKGNQLVGAALLEGLVRLGLINNTVGR